MAMKSVKVKIMEFLDKNKYAVLVLLLGIGLMLLPIRNTSKQTSDTVTTSKPQQEKICDTLERILSQIHGAGTVSVLLTEAQGERVIYQTDSNVSNTDGNNHQQLDTVTVTDPNKNQTGLIVQIEPPVYRGAIIVSEGADKPAVKLALVSAVSKVTGLGASQITVLKMK